ncbi:MAG TPA: DUF559 domain-containing protein [Actinomycetes bacterium]|nr:DUF559 domain-containing protein [Actinomycetes bacterium]
MPFPGVIVSVPVIADAGVKRRAALLGVDVPAALSHTSALAVWSLLDDYREAGGIHVMTALHHRIRIPGILAHRRIGFAVEPGQVAVRDGVRVTALEQTLADAWTVLPQLQRRRPIIAAINQWMTTPARIRHVVLGMPHMRGRASLLCLLGQLDEGCRSELEIWGYLHVFTGPGMPRFQRQVPIKLAGRTTYLDVFAEAERVNFELDGMYWHLPEQNREQDLRRDAALAAMGILVVRFSHHRLRHSPEEVRREVLGILSKRRM